MSAFSKLKRFALELFETKETRFTRGDITVLSIYISVVIH
jgi:hypothetical protein